MRLTMQGLFYIILLSIIVYCAVFEQKNAFERLQKAQFEIYPSFDPLRADEAEFFDFVYKGVFKL